MKGKLTVMIFSTEAWKEMQLFQFTFSSLLCLGFLRHEKLFAGADLGEGRKSYAPLCDSVLHKDRTKQNKTWDEVEIHFLPMHLLLRKILNPPRIWCQWSIENLHTAASKHILAHPSMSMFLKVVPRGEIETFLRGDYLSHLNLLLFAYFESLSELDSPSKLPQAFRNKPPQAFRNTNMVLAFTNTNLVLFMQTWIPKNANLILFT